MSALDEYAAKKVKAPKVWTPPTIDDFLQDFKILSFDQTLSATGWIHLGFEHGELKIYARGTIRVKAEAEGAWSSLLKADELWTQLNSISRYDIGRQWPDEVVMEHPAVHGYRIESSLMAAREVHRYTRTWFTTAATFMSIQKARTLLAGSKARDDKKLGHQALAEWIPESAERRWNEHQRDAAINALARLYVLKREAGNE